MKEIINNIEEPICSFEVSELLKEKGFGVSTSNFYVNGKLLNPKYFYCPINKCNSDFDDDTVCAPTHSIALEWIRVNFGIHIIVEAQFDENENENGYFFMCYKNNKDKIQYQLEYISGKLIPEIYNTLQEAIDAALLHVLKEII